MATEDIKKCNCDESLCCCGRLVVRCATANAGQDQSAIQLSINIQDAAIAIATDGGTAKATQQSCQSNTNLRSCTAIATSCTTLTCDNICEDTNAPFSASDQQDRQDFQAIINLDGIDTALAGEGGTAITRECTLLPNSINEIRTTIATSCSQVAEAQPDNQNQEGIYAQYIAPENLDLALKRTPLSSININGKVVPIHPRKESQPVQQVAFIENDSDKDNTNKEPLVLSFDKFHVILNLEGISLDAAAASDGNVSVNRKGVRR